MKNAKILFSLCLIGTLLSNVAHAGKNNRDCFPDGTEISEWYHKSETTPLAELGKVYCLTDYGVALDSTIVQTMAIQRVIDIAAQYGKEACVLIPCGTFLSGALHMRQGVNLYLQKGACLKGSTDISDFPIEDTRIEGQCCRYFPALINAKGIDGLKICGQGTIDGNGTPYWRAFWLRKKWNPKCTNKDEQRPRLVFMQDCNHVELSGVTLQNSPFWTTHLYRCSFVKLYKLRILSPVKPIKAPSTDAIDIDVCHDIHIKGCYMAVNDDAVVLKGGKGPYADRDSTNGSNERIIIEDCEYGFCHGCLTCGSESVHNRNIILRHIRVNKAARLLWLKMRPDTPQHYEHICVEDVEGSVTHFLYVYPWTQFFDLQDRKDMPISYADHITMRRCKMSCDYFLNIASSDQYQLSDFTFSHLEIQAKNSCMDKVVAINGSTFQKVNIKI